MASLEQLLAQIQSAQNSGTTMADPDAVVAQAQMQLLEALVAAVTALQSAPVASAPSEAGAAPIPTNEQLEALIAPLVSEAISTAFGRLENLAQPAVAQNTGSGAAPEAPSTTAASNGAIQTPVAAGTAPVTSSTQA